MDLSVRPFYLTCDAMNAAGNPTIAWEPLTPRGVAAFAHARMGRLFVVQLVIALLAAGSVAWFLDDSVYPVVQTAINSLPDKGEVRSAGLVWQGASPALLAEGPFLAFTVDLEHDGKINSTADLQIEFGRDDIWFTALLGYLAVSYPYVQPLPFNRTDLEPLWGAWKAVVLFLAAVVVAVGLLASWWLLAAVYILPVWLLGYFVNRDLNFRRSWQLANAALLPGALLMAVGILFYDLRMMSLVQFGFVFAAHFVLGWIYLFVSLLFVPGIPVVPPKGNPFTPPK